MATGKARFEVTELEDIDFVGWRNIRPYLFEPRKSSNEEPNISSGSSSDSSTECEEREN